MIFRNLCRKTTVFVSYLYSNLKMFMKKAILNLDFNKLWLRTVKTNFIATDASLKRHYFSHFLYFHFYLVQKVKKVMKRIRCPKKSRFYLCGLGFYFWPLAAKYQHLHQPRDLWQTKSAGCRLIRTSEKSPSRTIPFARGCRSWQANYRTARSNLPSTFLQPCN